MPTGLVLHPVEEIVAVYRGNCTKHMGLSIGCADKTAELENAEVVRMAPSSVPQRMAQSSVPQRMAPSSLPQRCYNYGTSFIYTLS